MSFLSHNCECGHPICLHFSPGRGPDQCSTSTCTCRTPIVAESIVFHTIDIHGNETELHAPGESVAGWNKKLKPDYPCNCPECVELYRTVMAS